MQRRLADSLIALLSLLSAAAVPSSGAPLSKGEQACVNGQSRLAERLAVAQLAADGACVAHAQRGRAARLANGGETATAQACLRNDVGHAVARAAAKLAVKGGSLCVAGLPAPPAFAYQEAAALTPVVIEAMIAVDADLFGADLDSALVSDDPGDPGREPEGARCQREVAAAARDYAAKLWRGARIAQRIALDGGGTPPAESGAEVTDEIENHYSNVSRPVTKAAVGLTLTLYHRCVDPAGQPIGDLAAWFPGCALVEPTARGVASCAGRAARCRACQAIAASGHLPFDCDRRDDFEDNDSCETPTIGGDL